MRCNRCGRHIQQATMEVKIGERVLGVYGPVCAELLGYHKKPKVHKAAARHKTAADPRQMDLLQELQA